MDKEPAEYRAKAIHVSEETVLTLLLRWQALEHVSLPVFKNIPDDVKIRGVWHDALRRGFMLVLEHPSFAPVVPGGTTPVEPSTYETVNIPLAKAAE